jgi:hypothetical protein
VRTFAGAFVPPLYNAPIPPGRIPSVTSYSKMPLAPITSGKAVAGGSGSESGSGMAAGYMAGVVLFPPTTFFLQRLTTSDDEHKPI